MTRSVVGLCGALVLASLCGCFESSTLQASFESSSNSSSSCSGSDKKDSAYQRDIRDYTATYAATGGDPERFQHDLGAIAESHGVTDWEADPATLVAIGRGLERTQVDLRRTQQLEAVVTHGDPGAMAWIRQGYACRPE
jgi:hypothetical protein